MAAAQVNAEVAPAGEIVPLQVADEAGPESEIGKIRATVASAAVSGGRLGLGLGKQDEHAAGGGCHGPRRWQ